MSKIFNSENFKNVKILQFRKKENFLNFTIPKKGKFSKFYNSENYQNSINF